MFFLFGSPRSGTTLLAQCLSAHPDIVVPDETDFIVPVAFVFDRISDLEVRRRILKPLITKSKRFGCSIGEYLSHELVEQIIDRGAETSGDLLNDLYAAVAQAAGVRIAGDKTPNDLLYVRDLLRTQTVPADARIIHIVRDVRDVTWSLMQTGWVKRVEDFFPRFWSSSNLSLKHSLAHEDRYLLVKYEEFVSQPERVLTAACEHLGVEFQAGMLDSQSRDPRYRGQPHHPMLYEQFSDRRIGAFRGNLTPHVLAMCEMQAAEGMAAFGFAPELNPGRRTNQ
jgi:hypothetical protein